MTLVLVLKNTKTGEYSDGNYGWTMNLNKARRYLVEEIPVPDHHMPDHHIRFVELKNEPNKSGKKTSPPADD